MDPLVSPPAAFGRAATLMRGVMHLMAQDLRWRLHGWMGRGARHPESLAAEAATWRDEPWVAQRVGGSRPRTPVPQCGVATALQRALEAVLSSSSGMGQEARPSFVTRWCSAGFGGRCAQRACGCSWGCRPRWRVRSMPCAVSRPGQPSDSPLLDSPLFAAEGRRGGRQQVPRCTSPCAGGNESRCVVHSSLLKSSVGRGRRKIVPIRQPPPPWLVLCGVGWPITADI